jgi:HPr kinase/phosphorylase
VEARNGRLLVRPAPALAGLIEVRGLGIRQVPHEPLAVVGIVVDLAAADAARLPETASQTCEIERITLPRLPVAAGLDALPLVFSYLQTADRLA